MKIIKSFLLLFAIIGVTFLVSCQEEVDTPITHYTLETPTNFIVNTYEDGNVLFFDGDPNAISFTVVINKDQQLYKKMTISQTELMLGIYLEDFEYGEYSVKANANADPESTDLNSAVSENFTFVLSENIVNPKPTNAYVVKFNTNGGSQIASQSVSNGGYASKPSNPTKTGYIFVEWQLNGKKFSFSTPITSDITLDAIWQVSTGGNTQDDDGLTNLSTYYKNAEEKSGEQLKQALRTIIQKISHRTTYDNLKTYLPNTDVDPKNSNNIILFYGHVSVPLKNSNGAATFNTIWDREHVWCQSLGWFTKSGAGSDVHHIRPEAKCVNQSRGNKKMGEVSNGKQTKYTDGTIAGYYNNNFFEPVDCSKGDVARIIFYLLVMYSESDSYSITSIASSLDLLLRWHLLDPVDDLERVRNERAYNYQGNRNPFIDYPEFAELIWE